MAFDAPSENHFEGGANLTKGSRKNDSDATLAEYFRKIKTGRDAFAAAGDLAVTFDAAFADTDYTIVWSFEDVGGGANDLVGQVKTGTKLATGFTVTIAGTTPDGVLHWTAIHD